MLLAQEYVPDLSEYKDKFMRTPLGLLTQGNVTGAVDRLGADAMLRVDAMSDPEAALQTGMDFMGGGLLGTTKLVNKTQMELANEIASKNAETMLGLPKGNTAMDRAKAMGFDVENTMYHGTNRDFSNFEKTNDIGYHFGDIEQANNINIIDKDWNTERIRQNANIIPTYLKTNKTLPTKDFGRAWDYGVVSQLKKEGIISPEEYSKWASTGEKTKQFGKEANKLLRKKGYDSVKYNNIYESLGDKNSIIILDPSNIRSINAAFDPARANESDILAGMIALPVGGLLKEQEQIR